MLPRDLVEAAAGDRLVPFVGAGVSRAVLDRGGQPLFPTWPGLLERAALELSQNGRDVEATLVTSLIRLEKPDYLDAARRARDGLKNRWAPFLKQVFDRRRDEASDPSLELARHVWKLGSPLVVTTNYDDVMTWAAPTTPTLVHVEDGGVLSDVLASALERPCVWHIHGHLSKPTELILTPDGYSRLYGSPGVEVRFGAALTSLKALLASRSFLFIGFSCDDAAVAREINWVNETFGESSRQHYLLVRESERTKVVDRLAWNVEILSYADHGPPLLALLDALATQASREKRARGRRDSAAEAERYGSGKPGHAFEERARDIRLDDIFTICKLRFGADAVTRFFGPPPFHEYLRVGLTGQKDLYFPVAFATAPTGGELLDAFAEKLISPARLKSGEVRGKLIVADPMVPPSLVERAAGLAIDLTPLAEFDRVLDFGDHLERQRAALEADRIYPPSLFVAQRLTFDDNGAERRSDDALETIRGWIHGEAPLLIVVLGAAGTGKTFLLREYARRFGVPGARVTPLLVPLRDLDRAHSLDQLLAAHFAREQGIAFRPDAFGHMLERGHVALLFDGFDELALRVGFDRAADHLDTLAGAVRGSAKVVVTSRKEHFRTNDQALTPLARRLGRTPHRTAELQLFEERQVKQFLVNLLGNPERAAARHALMEGVPDLPGLAQTPRLLSFITNEITDDELEEARLQGEHVTAAALYQRVLDRWLANERDVAEPKGSRIGLTVEQRWMVAERLALRLWLRVERTITEADLATLVQAVLSASEVTRLSELTHDFGARSLLVREGDDAFTFVHQSVLEWLVARVAAGEIQDHGASETLGLGSLSDVMIRFVWEMAGGDRMTAWIESALGAAGAPTAKQNALRMQRLRGIKIRSPGVFTGASLRGEDFSGENFARADLQGADLSSARLANADLSGARLENAVLRDVDARGANLSRTKLDGADFSFANLCGARLNSATMTAGTRFVAAKLVGASIDAQALGGCDVWGAALPGEAVVVPVASRDSGGFVALSRDGYWLASTSGSAIVVVRLETGRIVRILEGHTDWIQSLAFSADSRTLASGSNDQTVRVWDIATSTGRVLAGHKSSVLSVAFSPDGGVLASGSGDGSVRLWDLASSRVRVLTGHRNAVGSVAFSPDGDMLASGSRDQTVRLWDIASSSARVLVGHTDGVESVAFSPGGRTVASGSRDKTVRLWGPKSPRGRVLEGHTDWIDSVAFSPDGRTLASASKDMTVRLWYPPNSNGRVLKGHQGWVKSVAFSADGRTLASGAWDHTVRLWDLAGSKTRVLGSHMTSVESVAFSPDGRTLASGAMDHRLRLWDLGNSKGRVLGDHTGGIASVAFSPDGRLLASGSTDKTVRLWDLASSKASVLEGHGERVRSVAFSPDGCTLASASHDKTVRLWDLRSLQARVLEGHGEWVQNVAFSPNGRVLASGSGDSTVRVWDIASLQGRVLGGHADAVTSVAYSPDGCTLASGSWDGTVRLWDCTTWRARVLRGHRTAVESVAYSPDGHTLASGSWDGTVRLWDVASSKVRVLGGHTDLVMSVAFSRDGRALASAATDGTIRIWELSDATCFVVLTLFEEGWVAYRPDGRYLLEGDVQGGFGHAIGLCRFEVGELDAYYSHLRLPGNAPLISFTS